MIRPIPTSNYAKGRGAPVSTVVIHWMAGTLAGADARFSNPTSQVSAHYGVEDETIYQWVDEADTAYHAGNLTVNKKSVGIEHSANVDRPASDLTYQTAGKLLGQICKRHNIPLDRTHIIKHSEVKATACPGTMDLDRLLLIAKGAGQPVEPMNDLQKILDHYKVKTADELISMVDEQIKFLADERRKSDNLQQQLTACLNKPITSPNAPETGWVANGKSVTTEENGVKITINYAVKQPIL